ncbi:MAG: hypothetical protein JW846_03895 [Dehalococcoidia bacterium]|nr:hypothetical protein [Dehalococcoidia bacterium]
MKKRLVALMSLVALVALPAVGCVEASPPQEESGGQEPEQVILSPEDAFDLAVRWLNEQYPDIAPAGDAGWQVEDVTLTGPNGEPIVGASTRQFTSDNWIATMQWAVVAPQYLEYRITLKSMALGWYWSGSVLGQDGLVTEIMPMQEMSQASSQALAESFVKYSPTFLFDGMADTLELTDTASLRCPYCWVFTFEFDSSQAGYGDRTGKMLAQVITHHTAVVTVQEFEIVSAVMDEMWDMLQQAEMGGSAPQSSVSTVGELIANPVYETEVRVVGEVSLLGELFCPCFELTSGGESIQVWYGLMVENDGTELPEMSVEGIANGDMIVVTGMVKGPGGVHYAEGDFWAKGIEMEVQ